MIRLPPSLLLAALAGCGSVAPGGPEPASGHLDLLSYNVHGLPASIAGDDPAGRMPQIAPLLDDFDLVGLQEAFVDDYYDALEAGSSHTTRRRFAETLNDDRYYGSGLAVFTDLEELDHHQRHYSTCNGVLDAASDCLASKGLLAVRLQLAPGAAVDVYDTHLDAGGGAEDEAARATQVAELTEAIAEWSGERALIVMGDTNLHAWEGGADQAAWEQLVGDPDLTELCAALDCPDPEHIDRILFRDGGGVAFMPTDVAVDERFVDADGEDLSDHPALRGGLSWDFAP